MPIPKAPSNGWDSVESMNEAYFSMGWKKRIDYEFISLIPKIGLVATSYIADANKISCSCDSKGGDYGYIQLTPSGVVYTCAACRKTDSALQEDVLFTNCGSRRVSRAEANKIISLTHQRPPLGIVVIVDDPIKNLR